MGSRRRHSRPLSQAVALIAALLAGFGAEFCCALASEICCDGSPVVLVSAPGGATPSCADDCCERDATPTTEHSSPAPSAPIPDCGCERDVDRIADATEVGGIDPSAEREVVDVEVDDRPRSLAPAVPRTRSPPDSHRTPLRI